MADIYLKSVTFKLTSRIIINHVAGEIIRLVVSVCVYVRLSVGALLFEPFDLCP